jgi:hypothetical protein
MNILTVNLVLSTFVFWVAARLYVVPNLLVTHYLTFVVLTERKWTARWAS